MLVEDSMDIKQLTRDFYFEFKYLNEHKFDNLVEADRVALNVVKNSLQNAMNMLKELSLDEVIQVRKELDVVKQDELVAIEPLGRVKEYEDRYNKNLAILNNAIFDAKAICCMFESQKLDELA
jgi:hypothetical protein